MARWIREPENRLESTLGRAASALDRYFQVESLYRFNVKFQPRWNPRYLVYDGRLGLVRVGIAAMWAEGQMPKPRLAATSARQGTLRSADLKDRESLACAAQPLGKPPPKRDMTTLYQNAHSPERVTVNALQYLRRPDSCRDRLDRGRAARRARVGMHVGALGWILQRGVQLIDRRLTAGIEDSLRRAGIRSAEGFGRIWLLAGAIIVAAVAGGRKDGLAAAIIICRRLTAWRL